MTPHMPPWVFAGSHSSVNGALLRLAGGRDCDAHWEGGRNASVAQSGGPSGFATRYCIRLGCDSRAGAGNNEAERIAAMPGPERAIGEAAGKSIGEDLRAVEIEHWQIHDHPDHLPDGIDYYSLYRLTTPERIFFFEATHRITRLPGDAIELDISVYPFDKVGEFVYPRRQASEFSAAEIAYIRELIDDYLKTNREALHPVYAPAERVRSVRVRLP
jgi:hypothetical protein